MLPLIPMESSLYNPFDKFLFDENTCFLSGVPLEVPLHYSVFPAWILEEHQIGEQVFKMLDESYRKYSDLKLPCSPTVFEQLTQLDDEVYQAFQKGFSGVQALDQVRLFQWIGKWVYGIIFNEIQAGIEQQKQSGEAMNFSQTLVHKFSHLHLMLQSLIRETEFEAVNPFTIMIYPVDNPEKTYNYRDEINTLVFSLRIRDLGIIACLQDNGANAKYHQEILEASAGHILHPIQFEEICARFFYSCYLFNRLPEYIVTSVGQKVYIEPMSLFGSDNRPLFDYFQAKTYGQVLENFWKPWGLTLFEIIKDPENPLSFLTGPDGKFIETENLNLPASASGL